MTLSTYLFAASLLTWSFMPRFLKLMVRLSSEVSYANYHVIIPSEQALKASLETLFTRMLPLQIERLGIIN